MTILRCAIVVALLFTSLAAEGAVDVTVRSPRTISQYDVHEIIFNHSAMYDNPWEDVKIDVIYTHIDAKHGGRVGGFYYASGQYRSRYAPSQLGQWNWIATFTTPKGFKRLYGQFECVAGESKGFVRQHPSNPYRFVFSDGSLYHPIGFGDCLLDNDRSGSPLDNDWGLDGGHRATGGKEQLVTFDEYINAYADAGCNFFRWSIDNCSFKLWDTISADGNRYLAKEGQWGDELVRTFRDHGFRVMVVFYGFNPPFDEETRDTKDMAAAKRYIDYCINRYGAYCDFYELMNEANVPDKWISIVSQQITLTDPYDRPISTSWERPAHPKIDVNSPHWYENEDEMYSDVRTVHKINQAKQYRKPVIFGEQGNRLCNWDIHSGVRMRIRSWTAFFNEAALIYWNTSHAKDYCPNSAANVYLGPEERGYLAALSSFTNQADPDLVMAHVDVTSSASVRGYMLHGDKQRLLYLVHGGNHEQLVRDAHIVLPSQQTTLIEWISPDNGVVFEAAVIPLGQAVIPVPTFDTDIAARLTRVAPAGDFDHDGDIDTADAEHLVDCFGNGLPGCDDARLDEDNDVDQNDYDILTACFSSEDVAFDPYCTSTDQ